MAKRFTQRVGPSALAAFAASAMLLTAGTAVAQQPVPQPPSPAVKQFGPRLKAPARSQAQPAIQPPKVIGTHGDWTIQCEAEQAMSSAPSAPTAQPAGAPAPGTAATSDTAANGGAAAQQPEADTPTCGMVQTARHEKRRNVALTLVIVRGVQQGKEVTMMRVMAPIGVFLPTGVALEIDGEAVGRVPFTRCIPQMCIAFAEASPPTLEKLKKGSKANFIIYEAPGLGVPLELSLKGFTAALSELSKL